MSKIRANKEGGVEPPKGRTITFYLRNAAAQVFNEWMSEQGLDSDSRAMQTLVFKALRNRQTRAAQLMREEHELEAKLKQLRNGATS